MPRPLCLYALKRGSLNRIAHVHHQNFRSSRPVSKIRKCFFRAEKMLSLACGPVHVPYVLYIASRNGQPITSVSHSNHNKQLSEQCAPTRSPHVFSQRSWCACTIVEMYAFGYHQIHQYHVVRHHTLALSLTGGTQRSEFSLLFV